MKRLASATVAVFMVGGLATAAVAQAGRGPMMGPGGGGPMAGGAMTGRMAMMQARMGAPGACPGWAAATADSPAATETTPVTEDKAKALATEYATKYFKDYTVERVLPFQGRLHTAYQIELKGPKGDTRLLHVNPWGGIRPFPAPFATQ